MPSPSSFSLYVLDYLHYSKICENNIIWIRDFMLTKGFRLIIQNWQGPPGSLCRETEGLLQKNVCGSTATWGVRKCPEWLCLTHRILQTTLLWKLLSKVHSQQNKKLPRAYLLNIKFRLISTYMASSVQSWLLNNYVCLKAVSDLCYSNFLCMEFGWMISVAVSANQNWKNS